MRAIGIIPARYASTRFPAKALASIRGKSMIQRVYEQAMKANGLKEVVVATDDQRIYDHLKALDAQVVMTREDHRSGTDRCAEVAARMKDAEIIVNIQGDEPFIQPEQIDLLVQRLLGQEDCSIATLAQPIREESELQSPNTVKLVQDQKGRALYFSRYPIPFIRDGKLGEWPGQFLKHIGLYAFRRRSLLEISQLAPSLLEQAESLEQLRWLENGYSIAVALTEQASFGIDTPEDLERLEDWLDQQDFLSSTK